MAENLRQKEIREIHRNYRLFYELLGGAVLLLVGMVIGASFFGAGNQDYHMNLATEALGIAATVFIINRWYAHRDRERQREQAQHDEERQTEELKRRLVREAGSRSNDIAIAAIDELQDKGWLEGDDSLLKEAELYEADLQKANLSDCNLMRTVFYRANLQDANLVGSNLYEAKFNNANLQRAQLLVADLRNTSLANANLKGADMHETDLSGAYLLNAKLQRAFLEAANLQNADCRHVDFTNAILAHADLSGANMLEASLSGADLIGATLPDGSFAEINSMDRFTNPDHPEFEITIEKINEIRKTMNLDPIQ
ncbi:MAG: pentapeptide repeat-containing protein [Chloroflexota bacterium]|nr:pentapeptide repeat-containing protein [Chloroflexota bacterium]MDE2910282.1 pentapeptide repeat-containing protein [Chloroflexota bacterium]